MANAGKRVRNSNFSSVDCEQLLAVAKDFASIIECKKTDATTWRDKVTYLFLYLIVIERYLPLSTRLGCMASCSADSLDILANDVLIFVLSTVASMGQNRRKIQQRDAEQTKCGIAQAEI